MSLSGNMGKLHPVLTPSVALAGLRAADCISGSPPPAREAACAKRLRVPSWLKSRYRTTISTKMTRTSSMRCNLGSILNGDRLELWRGDVPFSKCHNRCAGSKVPEHVLSTRRSVRSKGDMVLARKRWCGHTMRKVRGQEQRRWSRVAAVSPSAGDTQHSNNKV
jgi:hypothetical protein